MSLVEVEEEGDDSVVGDSEVEGVSGGEFHGEGRIESLAGFEHHELSDSAQIENLLDMFTSQGRNKQSGHVTSFHS